MSVASNLHNKLVNTEDARLCLDIDERVCREFSAQLFIGGIMR